MSERPEPAPLDADDVARLSEQMTARSSAWPSAAEERKFTMPVALSPQFTAWAQAHGYTIVPESSVRTRIVGPEHRSDWMIWPTPSAKGLWAVGYHYPHGRESRLFDVADGDDLERVLYFLIGERIRFQRTDMRAIEYPNLAKDWTSAATESPNAPAELIDPDGIVRYRAHVSGSWHPRALSHILQMRPQLVATSYDRKSGMPLRRIATRRSTAFRVGAAVVPALIGVVIYWAANAGDDALTVTLFVVTAPLVVAAMVTLGAGLMLNAVDNEAPVRGRALWWVIAGIGGSGLIAELVAMWLAWQRASGTTWFYPLIAAAVAFTAAGIIWAVGAVVDR